MYEDGKFRVLRCDIAQRNTRASHGRRLSKWNGATPSGSNRTPRAAHDVPWRYRPFTSEAGLRPELAAQGIHLHIGDVRRELFQFGGIRPLDLYVYSDFRGSFSDPVKPDSEKELSPFCVP